MAKFLPPYFGAAYYPESWPREQIAEDLDRLAAHGLNTVRIAEFAWSTMEPEEGKYDLSLFREVVNACRERGLAVVLCTPSATPPSWMTHKHPELFVSCDGVCHTHGGRRDCCPTNPRYRQYVAAIVDAMAREFAKDENVIGWQVDNEIATMQKTTGCTCPHCVRAFRNYLEKKYGTVEQMNEAIGAYTWSNDLFSFDEVVPVSTHVRQSPAYKHAWEQCKNEVYADFCRFQADIIHQYTDMPVGTNMMPTLQFDLFRANEGMDIAQLNHYMGPLDGQFWFDAYRSRMAHPFWITETSPSWDGSCTPTGPRKKGFCRANTLATFALGSEMALYWLFRSHRGGYEMGHGSVIDAWGRDSHVSSEIREIAADLQVLAPALRGATLKKSGVAIVIGSLPYTMAKYAPLTTRLHDVDYTEDIIQSIYTPLRERHVRPDVITPDTELSDYRLIVSYRQYSLEENGFAERILPWVEAGGTWVVGPLSDVYTEHLAKYWHAPFGHLEEWADVRRDYFIPAPNNDIAICAGACSDLVTDDGRVAHTRPLTYDALVAGDKARVLASYADTADEYLRGYAAITETRRGKGRIILLGAALDREGYDALLDRLLTECGISPAAVADRQVSTAILTSREGELLTAVEATGHEASLTLPFAATDLLSGEQYREGQKLTLPPYAVIFAKKA